VVGLGHIAQVGVRPGAGKFLNRRLWFPMIGKNLKPLGEQARACVRRARRYSLKSAGKTRKKSAESNLSKDYKLE
jgi:hypothetical protein